MRKQKIILFLISLVVAAFGAALFGAKLRADEPVPYYVMGMLAYGLIFIGYLGIDSAARSYKNRYRRK
ncbi:hypothetical protein [Effusibacillus lacus]|uniref:Uncharacterized protein n=1 Tax=Effusibacillus lacus TaxID=1348429 RepID=A0A292YCT9_9BACL|nr:hypothetical protein [Effusibacillus lacus]TCS73596.1 hypothetical protein EDD64_1179 [Effusibacillus lacus]GAX89512.1 hypothetical protein [Effusibacillus lacus]